MNNWKEKLKQEAYSWQNKYKKWNDDNKELISEKTVKNICLIIDKIKTRPTLYSCVNGELALFIKVCDINISIVCVDDNLDICLSEKVTVLKDKILKSFTIEKLDELVDFYEKTIEHFNKRNRMFEVLNKIIQLKENWNDNGAMPISEKTYNNTLALLNHCLYNFEIYPTACSSIQLEYENDKKYLEIECFDDRYEIFIKEEDRAIEINYEISELYRVINEIKIFFNGSPKKSVLFSGSFNPPTIAHQHMISSAITNGNFDYVIFALSNERFLSKKIKKSFNGDFYFSEKERLDMILEMTWMKPNVLIYGIERGYTYDVLKDTKLMFNISELYFACGSDKLKEVERWGHSNLLLTEFCFYILKRMDSDEYINDISKRIFANTKYIIGTDNEKYENVNATNVRTLIKNKNDDYKNYLPDCISKFILNNKKSAT